MSGREIVRSLVFTTSAFLAGADQNAPEIRAPSVRGALRWWFRVLGGTSERERDLFGSVPVRGTPVASHIVVRVEPGKPGNNAKKLDYEAQAKRRESAPPMSYIGYFASVSGKSRDKGKPRTVFRTASSHYLGAGTAFTLRIWERRPVADDLWEALEGAVTAFCRLGALGLRATRGFGMVAEAEPPTAAAFRAWAATFAPRGIHLWEGPAAADAHAVLADALRALRREPHLSGKDKSALGFSDRSGRHASALRLCPVRVADGLLPVLLYTDAASSQPSCLPAVRDFLPRHGFSPLT